MSGDNHAAHLTGGEPPWRHLNSHPSEACVQIDAAHSVSGYSFPGENAVEVLTPPGKVVWNYIGYPPPHGVIRRCSDFFRPPWAATQHQVISVRDDEGNWHGLDHGFEFGRNSLAIPTRRLASSRGLSPIPFVGDEFGQVAQSTSQVSAVWPGIGSTNRQSARRRSV